MTIYERHPLKQHFCLEFTPYLVFVAWGPCIVARQGGSVLTSHILESRNMVAPQSQDGEKFASTWGGEEAERRRYDLLEQHGLEEKPASHLESRCGFAHEKLLRMMS